MAPHNFCVVLQWPHNVKCLLYFAEDDFFVSIEGIDGPEKVIISNTPTTDDNKENTQENKGAFLKFKYVASFYGVHVHEI